jgi:ABC-type uncharacterized transport system involved in gliding motility auxiliary subunit
MVGLFLALVVVVNVLVHAVGFSIDLTASGQFTLAEQTAAVLDEIDGEVRATAFFVDRAEGQDALQTALRTRVDDLLREFRRESDGRLIYRFVDPETDPTTATSMGVDRYPSVVFEAPSTGRRYLALASSNVEQSFLTGLLVVSGRGQKVVYMLSGHGELSPTDAAPTSATGFGSAAQGLTNDGYRVAELNLLAAGTVPSDAASLVIASPVTPLTAEEATALNAYLKAGGRVLVMLEPESDETWADWARRWGVEVSLDRYVIDPASHLSNTPGAPVVGTSQYPEPFIARGLDATVFPSLAPVGLIADPSSIPNLLDYERIAITTPFSFAAVSLTQTEPSGDDALGPFMVAVLVRSVAPIDESPGEDPEGFGTLVVFGDGQFVSNRFYPALSNADLFLNTVNELAGDVPLVPVRAKPLEFRGIVVTEDRFTLVRLLGWGLLPSLLAVASIVAWVRRR